MSDELLLTSLSYFDEYHNTHTYIQQISNGNLEHVDTLISIIRQNLANKEALPIQKQLSIQLTKDLIETFNPVVISNIAAQVLPIMEIIAHFRLDNKDQNRGSTMFIDTKTQVKKYEQLAELQRIGNTFFRLTLECIWIWSKWFPFDSTNNKLSLFKIAQCRLSLLGVTFAQNTFFKMETIINHLCVQKAPKGMLDELRLNFVESRDAGQNVKLIEFQQLLTKTFSKQAITYSTIMKQAVEGMRAGKLGQEIEFRLSNSRMKIMQTKLLQASQAKSAYAKHSLNVSAVISEKEKLLSEINRHVMEKDQLSKQIAHQADEICKYKQQISQLNNCLHLTTSELEQKQHMAQRTVSKADTTADNDKQIQRKENQLKRLQEQLEFSKQLIDKQNETISQYQLKLTQQDDELFQAHSLSQELQLKLESQLKKVDQQNVQIMRVTEQLTSYREQLQQNKSEYFMQMQIASQQMQDLQTEQVNAIHEKQMIADELEHYKLNLHIAQQETNAHKDNLKKISQVHEKMKSQQQFFQNNQTKCKNLAIIRKILQN